MVWNADSNNQDIVSTIKRWTGMDTVAYPLVDMCGDANMANREIWTWIHQAYGGWMYDDANNTIDFPTATTALVASQQDYAIPASALMVRGVEIKLNGSNVWTRIFPKTEEQIRDDIMAEKQFMSVASQPRFYTPYANSIKLYPASNYAQASSLRVSYERETVAFTPTGNDSRTPGFSSLYHEAVAIGAVFNFSLYKTISQKNDVAMKWADYKDRIMKDYQQRFEQLFPKQMTVRDAVQEAM
jgi:hypothetical protein